MSKVYQPNGIFTDEFNVVHDELRQWVEAIVEEHIKPFIAEQGAECMDIRLISAEFRDLVDLYMDSLWLDCLEAVRESEKS